MLFLHRVFAHWVCGVVYSVLTFLAPGPSPPLRIMVFRFDRELAARFINSRPTFTNDGVNRVKMSPQIWPRTLNGRLVWSVGH